MTHSRDVDLEPVPRGRVGAWLATFDPGYFAAVMATGIVSIGARMLGLRALSDVLLGCAGLAFVVLAAAYIARAVRFPRRFMQSLVDPSIAVAYFTLVAGTNVLGAALVPFGLWIPSLLLGLAAFAVWLVLTYGLFSSIVLAAHRPQLRDINGLWLVWVVGTQSVAAHAAVLSPVVPWPSGRQTLAATAVLFWGVGIILYLVLVVIILLRLLTIETTPAEMTPAYWILMGAAAISVHAAAGILSAGSSTRMPLLTGMHPFVVGLSVVLWSFGSWLIPILLLFEVWRYAVRRYSWRYEPKLWDIVFPLGMYTVASYGLGRAVEFGFMAQLAAVWMWISVASWCLVVALMMLAFVTSLRRTGVRHSG